MQTREAEISMVLNTFMYLDYKDAAEGESLRQIVADLAEHPDYGGGGIHYGEYTVLKQAVIHIIPWQISLAAVCLAGVFAFRNLFAQADYCLLGTFLGFFIFVGNLGRVDAFRELLQTLLTGREVLFSVLASQVISNVPAALLLSGFTDDAHALLVGTNLGGLGTLIASMASLISYKYISRFCPRETCRYLLWFTTANLLFLVLLYALYVFL